MLQGGLGSVAGAAVELTRQMQSLQAARQLCDSLLAIPSPGGSFFQAAIGLELAAMADTKDAAGRAQRLFEVGANPAVSMYIDSINACLLTAAQCILVHCANLYWL